MSVWKPPAEFVRIVVDADTLGETLNHLGDGWLAENIAYWAGVEHGADLRVTRLVKPVAQRGSRYVVVPVEEVARVVDECARNGDFIVAQLHTHPTFEEHSEVDDCGTVSKREGFVSLVVPCYGLMSAPSKPMWYGYQLRNGEWKSFNCGRIHVERTN